MQKQSGVRGDYFTDRLGGWTAVALAGTSFGIVLSRLNKEFHASDAALVAMYFAEILGAIAITRSKVKWMQVAFWIFALRVLGGIGYMSVIHGDKLARSTLGFPLVIAIYCWVRCRALRANP